jgi:hypothetical protein
MNVFYFFFYIFIRTADYKCLILPQRNTVSSTRKEKTRYGSLVNARGAERALGE